MLARRTALALSGAVLATSLVSAPALAGTSPAPAPTFRNSCSPAVAALPGQIKGAPAGFGAGAVTGQDLGLYVWHERKGWRVRLTHDLPKVDGKAQLVTVRGRITASRPLTHVQTVRLEPKQRGEWVAVKRPARRSLDFRFVNAGYIDGLNFTAGCAGRVTFTAWQVVKDPATGSVTKKPIPVFVGAAPTALTTSTTPLALDQAAFARGVSKLTVLRAPVG